MEVFFVQVVVFSLGKDTYAVEALAVQEILRQPEFTPIPEAPPYLLGMMDFRGVSIPLIHLGKLLSVSSLDEGNRAIVLTEGGYTTAFIVDDVSDVLNLTDDAIEKVPSIVTNASTVPKAVARVKDRLIIVIDPLKLLLRSQEVFE